MKFPKSHGFTLIEIIVVMAVFLLVMAASVVIFVSIINVQRKILLQEQLLSQASYAMEYMSKALRMAKKDSTGSCLTDYVDYIYLYTREDETEGRYKGIKFINENDNSACQEFYLSDEGDNDAIRELKNSTDDNDSSLLTAAKYSVKYFRTGVNGKEGEIGESYGASEDDSQQPRVTIVLGIEVPGYEDQSYLKIQTTVSQRNLNATE